MKMSFGQLLKKHREEGLIHTASSLSRVLGVSRQYISNIEKGDSPPPIFGRCLKIADALKLGNPDKIKFMKAAFLGRIKSNRKFYDYLRKEMEPI
jgi:transcriptional regulator with XRE-family HTH domain